MSYFSIYRYIYFKHLKPRLMALYMCTYYYIRIVLRSVTLAFLADTSSSVLSFLDVLEANIAEQQQMGSESTVPTGSVSSLSSIGGSKRVRLAAKIRRISHAQVNHESDPENSVCLAKSY